MSTTLIGTFGGAFSMGKSKRSNFIFKVQKKLNHKVDLRKENKEIIINFFKNRKKYPF
jgi:hypothetical protein